MSMKSMAKAISRMATPQDRPIPGREAEQVRNLAGGYSFPVDDWVRLDRFLVLGSENGAYYAGERQLTIDNAGAVARCVEAGGERAVRRIAEISETGRAVRNDAALLALAMAAKLGDEVTRKAALAALPRVARTATHLFAFCEAIEQLGGWGRGTRRAVGRWYTARDARSLAYQAVKYRQRNGWAHRDILRLAHPSPAGAEQGAIFKWITGGQLPEGEAESLIDGFVEVQAAESAQRAAALVRQHRLPREAVPTQFLDSAEVWEALLEEMPVTAMLRNLAVMTRVGLIATGAEATRGVAERLGDTERLRAARVHPMAILIALRTYASGRGLRGRGTWEPVQRIVDALDAAFYSAFDGIEPAGRRHLVAVDCSGSMMAGAVAGIAGFTPREAAAAMALVTVRTEPETEILGFTTRPMELRISPRMRLDDVMKTIAAVSRGEATDCAVPMRWARENALDVDAFVLYTDNQSWAGAQHPTQALSEYRRARSRPALLVSVGLVAYGDSIGDTADAGTLDVVGFDTAAPALIADFIRSSRGAAPAAAEE